MTNKEVDVYVVMEADDVMGVYDNQDEAERMCNNYFEAEVSEAYIMEITQPENA